MEETDQIFFGSITLYGPPLVVTVVDAIKWLPPFREHVQSKKYNRVCTFCEE